METKENKQEINGNNEATWQAEMKKFGKEILNNNLGILTVNKHDMGFMIYSNMLTSNMLTATMTMIDLQLIAQQIARLFKAPILNQIGVLYKNNGSFINYRLTQIDADNYHVELI